MTTAAPPQAAKTMATRTLDRARLAKLAEAYAAPALQPKGDRRIERILRIGSNLWVATTVVRSSPRDEDLEAVVACRLKFLPPPGKAPKEAVSFAGISYLLVDETRWVPEPASAGDAPDGDPPAGPPEESGTANVEVKVDEGQVAIDLVKEHGRRAREVLALAAKRDEAKERAKEITKAWEVASDDFVAFVLKSTAPLPLFDAPAPPPVDPQAWRAVRLDSLRDPAIPPGILRKLANVEIETLGKLSDATARTSDGDLGIVGIGPGAMDKIAAAANAYYARALDKEFPDFPGDVAEPEEEPAAEKPKRRGRPRKGGLEA